jgi:hypothetical protein
MLSLTLGFDLGALSYFEKTRRSPLTSANLAQTFILPPVNAIGSYPTPLLAFYTIDKCNVFALLVMGVFPTFMRRIENLLFISVDGCMHHQRVVHI